MIIRSSQQHLVTTIAKVAVLNFKSLNLSHFSLQQSLQNKLLNSFLQNLQDMFVFMKACVDMCLDNFWLEVLQ